MNEIPSYLESLPETLPTSPVVTNAQYLPIHELTWQNFERLCLRLERDENKPIKCNLYGTEGQDQQGIDIISSFSKKKKYHVSQCKHVTGFSPSNITKAINTFFEGDLWERCESFKLCTKESLRATDRYETIEAEKAKLDCYDIDFVVWDLDELCALLKGHPYIVDDFFGREWVRVFCGPEVATSLSNRLDGSEYNIVKSKLNTLYGIIFKYSDLCFNADPKDKDPIHLLDYYISPNINTREKITHGNAELKELERIQQKAEIQDRKIDDSLIASDKTQNKYISKSLFDWITGSNHHLILGEPGSGKSSLLRFVTLDVLSSKPLLSKLIEEKGHLIPIWIPFGYWTKIIESKGAGASLIDIFKMWLNEYDETKNIDTLIDKCLEDKRALFLIDGFDEYASLSSAGIATQRLQVFLENREAKSIASCRTHSFKKLDFVNLDWMTGEIANFTDEQIFQYSLKRFTNIISQGKDESEVDAKDQEFVRDFATKETKQFFVEIKSLPSIYYLASNPLMLNVLIDQKTNKQLIPNGKYEILKMMIENLVFEQPKRRDKAAGVTRASILSDNYKRQLLSYIAYTAFNENQSGLYRKDYLIEKIESYLIDEKMGLGWENYRARLNSEEIFEQKSGQLGILLEKTPDLFGFFHRSLQEYLSSNYVNKMDLDDKLEILETHMLDSEWREILLAIVSEQTNGHEIGEIINFLEKQVYANSPGKFLSTLLLAHLIILNPNTSAGLCKKHFDTIFNEVQIGEDSSISNEVINLLVQGLNDSKLSLLIEEQINYWFPCETRWRTFLIESLESWSKLDQVEKLLLKSFFSEDNYNQRATAKTYSKVFSGDEEKGRNLFNTFINSSNDDVKAALAEAIVLGWNESDFFNELMEHCNKSDSKHVKLIGLYGKLNKDGPSNEILDELISFTSKRSSFFYAWKTLLSSMFTEFYSGDEKLKAVCLNSFNLRYDSRIETINSDIAMEVMLTNYPQDSDVANLIKDHLENKNSYLMHNHDNWRLLGQNFKDNEILKEPFVNWCKRKSSASNVEISLGAGVAPTEELKQIIIKMLDDYCPFWAADALIRYWPDDKDVIESIKRFAETNDSIKSNLAESLRHVYKDDKAVREMLVDLVKSNQTIRIDIVLRAINQIDNGHIKDDVIDLYFSRSINRAELINQAGIDVLINSRPDHQLVKAAGLEELMDSDGAHYAVSKSLNDDPEIRKKISMKFNPLNTPERLHLCNNIKTTGIPTELKLKFMSKYRNEVNPRIRTISCISYYSTLMEVSRVTDEKVQALKDDLFARGPEYESMRQSAFIGLTIINRYDVIIEAKSPYKDEESYTLPHNSIVKENPELYEYLVINWNAIECGLGSQLFAVINPGRNSTYLWSELSDYLHLNSMLHSRVIDELEQNGANLNLRLIKIWYNSNPNSSGLMNECMNFITNYKVNSYHRENDTYFPSWIIGAKFASPENLSILSELTSNDPMNTLGIFAIQVGWPQSEISKKLFDYYVDNNIGADYYILTQLISNHSSIDHFVAFVIKMAKNDIISKSRNKFWIKGPFSDRIKIDSEISGSIFKRILSNEDLNIKGLGFLMGLIRNQEIPQELVEWILEFEKNISSEDLLVTCYDYYSGRIKTFAQQLELLS